MTKLTQLCFQATSFAHVRKATLVTLLPNKNNVLINFLALTSVTLYLLQITLYFGYQDKIKIITCISGNPDKSYWHNKNESDASNRVALQQL